MPVLIGQGSNNFYYKKLLLLSNKITCIYIHFFLLSINISYICSFCKKGRESILLTLWISKSFFWDMSLSVCISWTKFFCLLFSSSENFFIFSQFCKSFCKVLSFSKLVCEAAASFVSCSMILCCRALITFSQCFGKQILHKN